MRTFLSVLAAWAGLSLASAMALAQEPTPPTGNEPCKSCHVPHEEHKVNAYHSDCVACHIPQSEHLELGGRGTVTLPGANSCLSCHQNNDHKRMNWSFSAHKKAKLECRDCHGLHAPKVKQLNVGMFKSDKNSALCMSCHQDVAAHLNMPSHHPVKEGALSCTSCHDPHSGKQTSLRGKNAQCTECHQAIRGPKVFAHAPVVEDCTLCHNPHGSPNRRLLRLAQPMLCLQCHSITANRHATTSGGVVTLTGAQMRNCTNCHSAIHGSHSDPKLKY